MNDRFKFRAINKQTKKITYIDSFYWFEENGVSEIDHNNTGSGSFAEYWITQSTGLKDKNGKLIFDGDIVRVGNSVFEIVNELGCFMIATKTNIEEIHLFPNSWNDNVYPLGQLYFEYENEENSIDQLEVIGNIYKNKELLDEKI